MSEVDIESLFGKTKMNADTGPKFASKLKDGHNIVRIIPAFKSLASKGAWFMYHKQHFGYSGVDRKNAGKTKARPFKCLEEKNHQTKMVLIPCAECNLNEQRALMLKNKQAQALTATDASTKKTLEIQVKALEEYLKVHNLDKKYYMNVKFADGTFGTIGIGYKAFTALKAVMKKHQEDGGLDPFDPQQGVWFDFFKEGTGLKTEVSVSIVDEVKEINGQRYKVAKPAPLTRPDLEKVVSDCNDLPFVVKAITSQQIEQLVENGGDDPETVDLIFDQGTRREASPEASPVKAAAVAAQAVAVAPVTAPVAAASEIEALKAQIAALEAAKAAAPVTLAAPAVLVTVPLPRAEPLPGSATLASVTPSNDDDFMAMFGEK